MVAISDTPQPVEEASTEAPGKAQPSPDTTLTDIGQRAVNDIAGRVSRRTKGALIRNSFVRAESPENPAPLSQLASTKGRGAQVPLKLYLATLWLSATPPYDTSLSSAAWARVLDLPDPEAKGARRIRDAQDRLEQLKLIKPEPVSGAPNKITLLKENGSGEKYAIPYAGGHGKRFDPSDGYFKVPPQLWLSGQIQNMSTAALTMLLIVLEESRGKQSAQWWSMQTFEDRFAISKDVRARGTRELETRGLLYVEGLPLPPTPGASVLSNMRVRKTYQLRGEANPDWKPVRKASLEEIFGSLKEGSSPLPSHSPATQGAGEA